MMRRLLVGVSQLDHIAIVVGAAQKSYAGGQVVAGETRGDDNGRDEDEERVDMGRAFLVDERRIDSVFDQGRLVLDSLMHDGVQLVVGHDLEEMARQFFACQEVLIMSQSLPWLLSTAPVNA